MSDAADDSGDASSGRGRPGGLAVYVDPQLPPDERQRRRWQLAAALRLVPAASAAALLGRAGIVAAAGVPLDGDGGAVTTEAAAAAQAAWAPSVGLGAGALVRVGGSAVVGGGAASPSSSAAAAAAAAGVFGPATAGAGRGVLVCVGEDGARRRRARDAGEGAVTAARRAAVT